jgi:6-phosphogluconolactonase (cycloisomerase 2 family)
MVALTQALHRRHITLWTVLICVAVGFDLLPSRVAAQAARQTSAAGRGPVAIGMRGASEAVILHLDGRVRALDTGRWAVGSTIFQVPSKFQATDMTAGVGPTGAVMCLIVNGRFGTTDGSFLLQVLNGHETWSWLPVKGVYVGVAMDPKRGVAYASNSSTNEIFQVRLAQEKGATTEVLKIRNAERLGPIAIDTANQRLFAVDTGSARVFVIDLNEKTAKTIDAVGLEEARALAWDPATRRLYVADSGSETISSIDIDGANTKPQTLLRDPKFRQPSGLVVGSAGSLLATDESAAAVLQVLMSSGTVQHVVSLSDKPDSR